MIRFLFTASAVLLLAWDAAAAVLGRTIDVPVEWVWVRDPRLGVFRRVAPLQGLAVSSNGTDFFVAWSQRGMIGVVGPNGEPPRTARAGVFGVRIDAAGNVLDAVPITLTLEPVSDVPGSDPRLGPPFGAGRWLAYAASSDSYLAAWPCAPATCLARVDSFGALLQPSPIRLPSEGLSVVASDGEDHFVLGGNQMFSVDPDGTVLAHPLAFKIGAVTSDGTNLLNVTPSQITLFDTDGATLNETAMPFPAFPAASLAVTFDQSDYLVLWHGRGPGGNGEYVTRVDTDGELLDTSERLKSPFPATMSDISFDGINEVGAWCLCVSDTNSAAIAVISADDEVIATDVFLTSRATSPVRRTLSVASTLTGVSLVVVDGLGFWPFPPVFLFPCRPVGHDAARPGGHRRAAGPLTTIANGGWTKAVVARRTMVDAATRDRILTPPIA